MAQVIEHFHFVRPMWLLAILPFALLLWMFIRRSLYAGSWTRACDEKLLPHVLEAQEQHQSHRGIGIIGFLGVLAIIALAGPAWKELPQPVFRAQTALIIALDLSRSMDVADVKPSRLARARHKIIDILNRRKEGQTALIVYALEPFVVTPLTQDNKTVANLVNDLVTQLMPGQGSYPEKAILKSVELFKQTSVVDGHVLLITDGIESDGMEAAIQQLTEAGHRLSILGIGTSEGAPIARQGGGFLKDRSGAIVVSKLNEDALKEYALQGQGIYRHISAGDSDINSILRVSTGSRLESDFVQQQEDEMKVKSDKWREEGPWILLILIPLVALVFRRGYLGVLLIALLPIPQQSHAFNWQSLWQTDDQRAARAMKNNDPQQAANLFTNPQWKAAAQYRAELYEDSLQSLEGINTPDALYNKGNTLAKMGRLQEAIASYNEALKLAPDMEDAKHNRDLLQKYMEQQQQQQDQQDQQQNSGQDNQQNENSQQQQQGQQGKQQDDQQQAANQQQKEQSQNQQQENKNSQQQQSSSQQDEQQEELSEAQQAEAEKQAEEQLKQQLAKKQDKQEQGEDKDQQQSMMKPQDHFTKENQQMQLTEQWLRRIPDDPGGLLRRKFRHQSQIDRGEANQETKPW